MRIAMCRIKQLTFGQPPAPVLNTTTRSSERSGRAAAAHRSRQRRSAFRRRVDASATCNSRAAPTSASSLTAIAPPPLSRSAGA